jgi:two-component system cell cycle sensor histidine kinase/response regulator CckA
VPRVLFLTGGAFTAGAREFLDQTPNPRIEKPLDAQNVRAIVRSLLR